MNPTINPADRSFSDALGSDSKTAVNQYDLVSSFLMASVGLVGLITGLLALLFFLNMEWDKQPDRKMFVVKDLIGFEKPEGIAEEIQEPGVQELAELEQPQLADALEQVTEAISLRRAAIEAVDGTPSKPGPGNGLGSKRQSGLNGPGTDEANPAEHWVIRYSTSSKESYASQLDAFGIELGSLSKESTLVEYASDLSAAKPGYRKGVRRDEKRIYFKKPDSHPATLWDKQLLSVAGAQVSNRFIFNFYPPQTVQKLFDLESARLLSDQRKIEDVKQTLFGVRKDADGKMEYYLIDIRYY